MSLTGLIFDLGHSAHYLLNNYPNYFYLLIFLIVFAESGVLVLPFLPAASLIFFSGALVANHQLNYSLLLGTSVSGSIAGDISSFLLGKLVGQKLLNSKSSLAKKIAPPDLVKKSYSIYDKYGAFVVLFIAKCVPLLHSLIPMLAGIGKMAFYKRFILASVGASFAWALLFSASGVFFGNIPLVRHHLALIEILALVLTVLFLLAERFLKK